jgi:hypothetical protein
MGDASIFLLPVMYRAVEQVSPNTAYMLEVAAWVDSGHGLAGVTFFSGAGVKLSAEAIQISATSSGSTSRGTFVAPPGAYFVALWAGKWTGGGQLQVLSWCPQS